MLSRRFIIGLLAICVLALLVGDASACPTCKAALASHDGQQGDIVGGFMWSILFMMSMPYIILGSFGYLAFVSIRRAKSAQALEESGDVTHT